MPVAFSIMRTYVKTGDIYKGKQHTVISKGYKYGRDTTVYF
jgi:hypothetical protein